MRFDLDVVLFRLSSPALATIVFAVVAGTTIAGVAVGRHLTRRHAAHEPLGVLQAALIGFVALLLAFGLTMAVGRYESRRAAVVEEANAIGTTYLRAQTLVEPERSESMRLLTEYADTRLRLSDAVPESAKFDRASGDGQMLQRRLWGLAGRALDGTPRDSAPRLYVESLNQMIDANTTRVSALANRIPASVLFLQIAASALALGVLAMYLAMLGRGVLTAILASVIVTVMLLVIFDLDRPVRGLITEPKTALQATRASMNQPPAASAPHRVMRGFGR
jgi:hypothetical protein